MLNVFIRTDASTEIGNGHLLRCLTLTDELARQGCDITFICRALPGHRGDLIKQRGYALHLLPAPTAASTIDQTNDPRQPPHSRWLGCDWQQDAAETQALLMKRRCDWLVVDHYALDHQWQAQVVRHADKLLVIDDLADRHHLADLLVDSSPGGDARRYQGLLPPTGTLMCGSRYALLRPEFSGFERPVYQAKHPFHLLLAMGGVDKDNISALLLQALAPLNRQLIADITVLLSASAIHQDTVQQLAQAMPLPTHVAIEPSSVAELLQKADLAIGAPGGSALERCAMALPSLMIISAENQRHNAEQLSKAGAAIDLGEPETLTSERLRNILQALQNEPDALNRMAKHAKRLCDGQGARRIAKAMFQQSMKVRPANSNDRELLFQWQIAPGVRQFSRHPQPPTYREHCHWFARLLEDSNRSLFVLELAEQGAGMLRFDKLDDAWEISILIAPEQQQKGLAAAALEWAKHSPFQPILAEVHPDNLASQQLFSRCGFQRIDNSHFSFNQSPVSAVNREN